ncbi:MAG: FAD:protein FMN transferase [Phycisphaerae bacterium]|nr:FAD:protein FMN transferase [Phycisphaerae bacterium]
MHFLTRRRVLVTALGGAGAWALWKGRDVLPRERRASHSVRPDASAGIFVRKGRSLGTEVSISAIHHDEGVADRAMAEAFAELGRIESVLSLYRPDSQVSQLNRDGVLRDAHPALLEVLVTSLAMSQRTGGAFDVTVQPLWETYADAAGRARLPADEEIEAARRRVDWRQIRLSSSHVELKRPGMAVTFNGIAQGYAADRVKAVLQERGIRQALVDIGEIGVMGEKSGEPWKIGIQHPRAADAYVWVAQLKDRSLATSGDYATTFSEDHRDHHIFDPATGRSPTEFASVSVAAPTTMAADALSTAIFVLGHGKGVELVRSTPGADALFVFKNGSVMSTEGFPQAV